MQSFSLKLIKIFPLALIVLALMFLTFSAALAFGDDEGPDIVCEKQGGSWSGTSGPTATGTCTYSPGTAPLSNCSPEDTVLRNIVGGRFVDDTCIPSTSPAPAPASAPAPGPAQLGKCKLLSIDSLIHTGTSFSASWIGNLDSIRFRRSMAGTVFVPPLAGTVHFEDGHRAGEFSPFGLDRGRWEATCFGPEGTFGTAKIVFVH